MSYYIIEKPNKIYKKPFTGRRVLCSETVLRNGMNKYGGGIIYDSLTGKVYFIPNRKERSGFISFVERVRELPIRSIGERVVRINIGEMTSNMAVAQIVGLMTLPVGHIYRGYRGILGSQDPKIMVSSGLSPINPPFGAVPQFSMGAPAALAPATVPSRLSTAPAPARPSSVSVPAPTTPPPRPSRPPPQRGSLPPPPDLTGIRRPYSRPTHSPPKPPSTSGQIPVPPSPSTSSTAMTTKSDATRKALLADIEKRRPPSGETRPLTIPPSQVAPKESRYTPPPEAPRSGLMTQLEQAVMSRRSRVQGSPSPERLPAGKRTTIEILKELKNKLYDGALKTEVETRLTDAETGNKVGLTDFKNDVEEILRLCDGITKEFDEDLYNKCQTTDISLVKTSIKDKREEFKELYKDTDDTCTEEKLEQFTDNDNTVQELRKKYADNYSILEQNNNFINELVNFIFKNVCPFPQNPNESNIDYQKRLNNEKEILLSRACIEILKFTLVLLIGKVNARLVIIKSKSNIDMTDVYKNIGNYTVKQLTDKLIELTKILSNHYKFNIEKDYTSLLTNFNPTNIQIIKDYYSLIQDMNRKILEQVIDNIRKVNYIITESIYNMNFIETALNVLQFKQKFKKDFDKNYNELVKYFDLINCYIKPTEQCKANPDLTKFESLVGDNLKYQQSLLKLRNGLITIQNPFLLIPFELIPYWLSSLITIDTFNKTKNPSNTFKKVFKGVRQLLYKIEYINNNLNIQTITVSSIGSLSESQTGESQLSSLIDKTNDKITQLNTYKSNLSANLTKLKEQNFNKKIDKDLEEELKNIPK